MSHSSAYLYEVAEIARSIPSRDVENLVEALVKLQGRIYCVGVGGGAAGCSHMAADFRKLCDLDAVALDSVAELTARANDEGMDTIFTGQLSRMTATDALFVLSVGGGTSKVSASISRAVTWAKSMGAKVFGIVGPVGGETARFGDFVLKVPAPEGHVTPHTEAFQAVLWHCLVSHPRLQKRRTTW